MRHYPDLGSASDWSCCEGNLLQAIRSATQIWVVMLHSFLRRYFMGKPPVVSQNVVCFLKLGHR